MQLVQLFQEHIGTSHIIAQASTVAQNSDTLERTVEHTVELLDWAYGGPVPRGLEALARHVQDVPEARPLMAVT